MKYLIFSVPVVVVLFVFGPTGFKARAKTNSPSDSEALEEIRQMSQQECRDAFHLNSTFYQITKDMTETERLDYFKVFADDVLARGMPSPRPPPSLNGLIFNALRRCADGRSARSRTD